MPSFERAWAGLEVALTGSEAPLFVLPAGAFASFGPDIVAPLAAKLVDDDLRIVFAAALALAQVPHPDAVVPQLVQHLADPHPLVAAHARWALRELGPAALPALHDCYVTRAQDDRAPVAGALGFLGPGAGARSADIVREDARVDPRIAAALKAIEGPWPDSPEIALAYIGEVVRLDDDGPSPLDTYGLDLWIDLVHWHADIATNADDWNLWSRGAWDPEQDHAVSIEWYPDQIAIARAELTIAAYSWETNDVVTTTIAAANGRTFTNLELLWRALDAHHRIARCNDRIFEGLSREDDGSYYIATGS